jgi:hypothetical protein
MKFVEQFCSFIAQMNRNHHVYFVTIVQKRGFIETSNMIAHN